jgi:hypothetical protein
MNDNLNNLIEIIKTFIIIYDIFHKLHSLKVFNQENKSHISKCRTSQPKGQVPLKEFLNRVFI